jgi:hypothetical protein
MGSQGVQLQTETAQSELPTVRWSVATRIAFRFCFVYFGLYCLLTQLITSLIYSPMAVSIPDPATLPPFREIIMWTATHILRIATPLSYSDTGSGDKLFDWVLLFCLLMVAIIATAVWSFVGRKRQNYVGLYKWFRLALLICLAGQMLTYGFVKAVPLQMPYPYLAELIEPFGNHSPMGILWGSVGSSPHYEIFAGCAEILGGVLLLIPRTTVLGALICLADMIQVFTLNMTYDVPVKELSFHLILISLFLLAPDLRRLANFFVFDRPAAGSSRPPLFSTARANRVAMIAQVVIGIYLVGINLYGSVQGWYEYGGGSPKTVLYGIWNVDQLSIDGQVRAPLTTDYGRWHRVVFDVPSRVVFQRMDESNVSYRAAINPGDKTVALTKRGAPDFKANFAFQRLSPDQLILDGEMGGHKIRMQLGRMDEKKLLLMSRGFHWVQETPFNR